MRLELTLHLRRGCHSVARARKDDEEGIALRVDLVALVPLEGLAQEPLVLSENLAVALAKLALEPRRSLDVRKQERNRPTGQLGQPRVHLLQCVAS